MADMSDNSPEQQLRVACADLDRRLRAGESCQAEEYLERSPVLAHHPDLAIELIYTEFSVREELGENPTAAQWYARFPQWRDRLQKLFSVHEQFQDVARATTLQPRGAFTLAGDFRATQVQRHQALGQYEILEEIGRGGMGVVYKARQVLLNRLVAIKMILVAEHAEPHMIARFRAEAEALARLQHPNIVQIFEVNERDGHPYIVLEFVDGIGLDEKLGNTPLPLREAAGLVEILARAIHAAHERGIIHCDLKPANVLLVNPDAKPRDARDARHGNGTSLSPLLPIDRLTPKITDFGLARRIEMETGFTKTGDVLGTPSYMAPEQAAGKVREISPATDIHALGAMLYEGLTGRPPFQAASPIETMEQVRTLEPVSLTRLQTNIPRDLETICLKCLQKEPRRRYASALALAEDLRRFLDHEPISARPVGGVERTWRWCRRNPLVATLAGSVFLLALVVALGSLATSYWLRIERDAAMRQERKATDLLWQSYLDQARANRHTGRSGQRFNSLERLADAAKIRPSPQLRDEAIACLALADLREIHRREGNPNINTIVDFDAETEAYACLEQDRSIAVRAVADGRVLRAIPTPTTMSHGSILRFGRTGKVVGGIFAAGTTGMGRCIIQDRETGEEKLNIPCILAVNGLEFSADDSLVALLTSHRQVSIHELGTGKLVRRFTTFSYPWRMAFDPRGRWIGICGRNEKMMEIREVGSGRRVVSLPHASDARTLAWRQDGRYLATAGDDTRVYLWETESFELRRVLSGHDNAVVALDFHPDGDLLMSGSWDGTTRLWQVTTGQQLVLADGLGIRFSRDGNRLAFQDGADIGLWEVGQGDECRLFQSLEGPEAGLEPRQRRVLTVDASSDGKYLAAAGDAGVSVWEMDSGASFRPLDIPAAGAARFRPGSQELVTFSPEGLFVWELPTDPQAAWPPSRSLFDGFIGNDTHHCAWSADGKWLVINDRKSGGIVLFDLESSAPPRLFPFHRGIRWVAISPDGAWIAAGTWQSQSIGVWNVESGKLVKEFLGTRPGAGGADVGFSPKGTLLACGAQGEYQFHHVGSWKTLWTIPRDGLESAVGPVSFTHDGKIAAIAISLRKVSLIDLETGQKLATLTPADEHVVRSLCFARNDEFLAVGTDSPSVQLWNLPKLRAGLTRIHLDWNPPSGTDSSALRPIGRGPANDASESGRQKGGDIGHVTGRQ